MATIPRPSVIQLAEEKATIPLPERVTIALAALSDTAREGLLALSVGVGLAVVGEIFEEEILQLVGPRGKHSPERRAYRHGREERQLTLGGRRVAVQKPRGRTKAGGEVELESYRFFASRDLLTQAEYVIGDLAKDAGVDAALRAAEVVVHCAGSPRMSEDVAQAGSLVRGAQRAGVRHLLNISVVGADRIPVVSGVDRAMFAYFASQLAVERTVAESDLPWTNLRATQFYDGFILFMVLAMAKLLVIPVPAGFRFQPVDAGEVAARLVELSLGPPARLASDIAGPKVYEAVELLRGYLKAMHKHRLVVPVRIPGRAARAIRAGANLAPIAPWAGAPWRSFWPSRRVRQIARFGFRHKPADRILGGIQVLTWGHHRFPSPGTRPAA